MALGAVILFLMYCPEEEPPAFALIAGKNPMMVTGTKFVVSTAYDLFQRNITQFNFMGFAFIVSIFSSPNRSLSKAFIAFCTYIHLIIG